jgi:hypothetical protein
MLDSEQDEPIDLSGVQSRVQDGAIIITVSLTWPTARVVRAGLLLVLQDNAAAHFDTGPFDFAGRPSCRRCGLEECCGAPHGTFSSASTIWKLLSYIIYTGRRRREAAMRLPGFTAESSIYRTAEHYSIGGSWASAANQQVLPASCIGACFQGCMAFGHMSKAGCMTLCRMECRNPF